MLYQIIASNAVICCLIINFLLIFLIDGCGRIILRVFKITVSYITVVHCQVCGTYYTTALATAVSVPFNRGYALVVVVVRTHFAQTGLGFINSNHHIGYTKYVIFQYTCQQSVVAQGIVTYRERKVG